MGRYGKDKRTPRHGKRGMMVYSCQAAQIADYRPDKNVAVKPEAGALRTCSTLWS